MKGLDLGGGANFPHHTLFQLKPFIPAYAEEVSPKSSFTELQLTSKFRASSCFYGAAVKLHDRFKCEIKHNSSFFFSQDPGCNRHV